ncbi:unnamed protein product [Brassica rapa]|uniref:PPM-type phosphatase domain-containing protein n=1 Tax=Brassica campestris TaxID=3711 RepID=A0A3P5YVW7_BRACM|nr:unnamed protein product [Brassica rapa]VDC67784.1 unnamed protein product [Brassica rapa]
MNNTGHKNQDQSSANKNEPRAFSPPSVPRSPTMKPGHVSGLFLPGPIESGLVSGPENGWLFVGIYDGLRSRSAGLSSQQSLHRRAQRAQRLAMER